MKMKNSCRIFKLLLFCASALICAGAVSPCFADATPAPVQAPGAVTIRYKFTPGQSISYKVSTDINSTMLVSGQTVPMKQHIDSIITQTVQSVAPDGDATLKSGVSSMQMTSNGQPMTLPDEVQKKLEAGSTMTMTPTGKVENVSSPSSAGGMPGMDMSGSSPFGQMALLPTQPAKVGDVWRGSMSMAQLGTEMSLKMTLAQMQQTAGANIAEINSKYYAATKPGGTTPAGAPMKMNMLMTGAGTTDFDIDAGNVKSSTATMNMAMTMNPPTTGAQTPAVHMNMVMNIQMDRQDTAATPDAPVETPTAPATPAAPVN